MDSLALCIGYAAIGLAGLYLVWIGVRYVLPYALMAALLAGLLWAGCNTYKHPHTARSEAEKAIKSLVPKMQPTKQKKPAEQVAKH